MQASASNSNECENAREICDLKKVNSFQQIQNMQNIFFNHTETSSNGVLGSFFPSFSL